LESIIKISDGCCSGLFCKKTLRLRTTAENRFEVRLKITLKQYKAIDHLLSLVDETTNPPTIICEDGYLVKTIITGNQEEIITALAVAGFSKKTLDLARTELTSLTLISQDPVAKPQFEA